MEQHLIPVIVTSLLTAALIAALILVKAIKSINHGHEKAKNTANTLKNPVTE